MSLKKNLIGNGIANLLQKFVRITEQLLLVPFFISSWGAAYYGEWLTLTIIPSVLAFSDLGFGSAVANSFVLKYASGDKKAAADIFKTGLIIISKTITLGIIISALLLTIAYYFGWLEKSLIKPNEAIQALIMMITARLIAFYSQIFEANFRAARKVAQGINLLTVNSILNIACGAIVLLAHGGVVLFASSQLIIAILFNVFYWWKASAVLGLGSEEVGVYNKSYAKEIISKGFGYLMSPMWQTLLFQGTTFVVRITLGPAAVAVFNTVRTLSRSVNQLYSTINASVFPEIQFEIGAGRMDKARNLLFHSIRVSFVLALAGVLFLSIFGLYLYNIWTNKALNPPAIMWYLFLGGILLNAVWWTSVVVFRAMNKPYRFATTGLIAAGIAIICSYFFCKQWGLIGAAMGSLVFEIIMMIYILPLSCKMIGLPVLNLFKISTNRLKQPKNV